MTALPSGTPIRVIAGSYQRMSGHVVRDDGGETVVIELEIFGSKMNVTVSASDVASDAHPEGVPTRGVPSERERAAHLVPVDYDAFFTEPDEGEIVAATALWVPSGRITAFDPTHPLHDDYAPFERSVPEGPHPVSVLVVDGRTRMARVRFTQATVKRWVVAEPRVVDAERIMDSFNIPLEEPYRYECRGCGAFADADLIARTVGAGQQQLLERTVGALFPRDRAHPPVANVDIASEGDPLLIPLFSAHDGGPVLSCWGEDETGQVVALVSDFSRA